MRFAVWIESLAGAQAFLAEYRALTTQESNWYRNYQGVRIGLDLPNDKAQAIYPDSVYLYEIVAQGGRGSEAMKMIVGLADKHGVIIEGHVQPMDDKRRDENWLLGWYSQFGFQKVKKELAWDEEIWHIVRHPRSHGATELAASSAL